MSIGLPRLQEALALINQFDIRQVDPQTTILTLKSPQTHSGPTSYLIKDMEIPKEELQYLPTILETLSLHQDLSSKHLLTLLHHEVRSSSTTKSIQAIYEYGHLSLRQEIEARLLSETYFEEGELWAILATIVKSLGYLQEQGIVYGVLGSDKIFIHDNSVRILDPSATATDPLLIEKDRLYSPEILNDLHDIDMFKSDVYVAGVILLECGMLENLAKAVEPDLSEYFTTFSERYSEDLCNILKMMLESSPNDRPSFSELKHFLVNELDMNCTLTDECDGCINPAPTDPQNQPSSLLKFSQEDGEDEKEFYDILYEISTEDSPSKVAQSTKLTEYENALSKYLCLSSPVAHHRRKNHHATSTVAQKRQQIELGIQSRDDWKQNSQDTNFGCDDVFSNQKSFPKKGDGKKGSHLTKTKQIKEMLVRNKEEPSSIRETQEYSERSDQSHSYSESRESYNSGYASGQTEQIFTDPKLLREITGFRSSSRRCPTSHRMI